MKKLVFSLVLIFSILAVSLPVMLAYKSALSDIPVSNYEQVNTLNYVFGKDALKVDYTPNEISHLQDVQRLIKYANYYFIFLIIIEIFLLISIYQADKKEFYRPFLYGGLASFVFIFMVLSFMLTDFGSVFTLFHLIFFPQGNWQFASGSLLINLFPESFFYQIAKEIFVKSIIFSIIFIILGLFLRKKTTKFI